MKAATLKKKVLADLEERGTRHTIDEHIVDIYCSLVEQYHVLAEDIKKRGVMYLDERDTERANPSLRAQSAIASQIVTYAKMLGIAPYGRKLTTGMEAKKKEKKDPAAGLLRPIRNGKAKAK